MLFYFANNLMDCSKRLMANECSMVVFVELIKSGLCSNVLEFKCNSSRENQRIESVSQAEFGRWIVKSQ